jgi:hypothetical protein
MRHATRSIVRNSQGLGYVEDADDQSNRVSTDESSPLKVPSGNNRTGKPFFVAVDSIHKVQ